MPNRRRTRVRRTMHGSRFCVIIRTRQILDHLLHQTFAGQAEQSEPESDLLLDTNPDPETIRAVLGRYPFRDVQGAYHNLVQLAQESVPFLSTRRCRHFLASIAPAL